MNILGIHIDTHETGAVLLANGEIAFAINEERLSRIKQDSAFPNRSIEMVLNATEKAPCEIDVIAFSGYRPGLQKLMGHFKYRAVPLLFSLPRLFAYSTKHPIHFLKILKNNLGDKDLIHAVHVNRNVKNFLKNFRKKGFTGRVVFVPHDRAHAATAYYTSGFDTCLIPVFEGYSYINASSLWYGEGGIIRKVRDIPWPHSPGSFYRCVTQLLGFKPRSHAGKITGLAAFGNPKVAYPKVSKLLQYKEPLSIKISPLIYTMQYEYDVTKQVPSYLHGFSHENIAAAFQKVLEDVLSKLVEDGLRETKTKYVALAGGVAANVKLNQKVVNLEEVEKIFVFPAMSDAGQALGAALAAYTDISQKPVREVLLENIYLGSTITDTDAKNAISGTNLSAQKEQNLPKKIAALLSEGKTVALCRGKMEYGPRALGNRSILSAPTDVAVNEWLNKKLNRTEFMPFAPVTLRESASKCYDFEELRKAGTATEFMTVCMNCSEYMKKTQPAVVHVDGTARPQLIRRKINPFYYDILKEYELLTGLPSLINTSFNMHEEPIVCSAKDAVQAFQLGHLDVLILGDYMITNHK